MREPANTLEKLAHQLCLTLTNPASAGPLPNPHNERDKVLSEEEWTKLYQSAKPQLGPVLLSAYHLGSDLVRL